MVKIIFYDFEVFKYNWMVHFIDVVNKTEVTIVDDRNQLREFYEDNKDKIYVGFNNAHYDQFIYKALLLGMDPWKVNEHIMAGESGWAYSPQFFKIDMIQHDVMTGYHGLKQLEGFMGHNIKETSVDFTIDRPLTPQEIVEVVDYCKYDVEQTIQVFLQRQDEFQSKMDLVKEFKLPIYHIGRTNAQLSAIVLNAVKQTRRDEFDLDIPDTLRVERYDDIVRWYKNPVNHSYKKKLEVEVAGVPHIFAWGGLHGARNNYIKEGKFVLVDVSSYYPSLMIQYDYMSRNIADKQNFIDMYKERFRLKKAGDSKEAVFKLVLNTTYGCMGDKYNNLYDPRMRNNVCVSGQLLLLDLIESYEDAGIKLIQSNTDGILLEYNTEQELDTIKAISEEWSERTRLNLDYDYFYKIIQKDVNNYIALGDEYNVFVGAYVKDLNPLDYDLPVINKALKSYFIDGITPDEYIANENRLIEYQKIVKVSSLFDYAIHNGERLTEKTIRVFASKNPSDTNIVKYRKFKGIDRYYKFSNTSENVFIDNGYVKDKEVPEKLDKRWYIDLAWDRIEQFIGG